MIKGGHLLLLQNRLLVLSAVVWLVVVLLVVKLILGGIIRSQLAISRFYLCLRLIPRLPLYDFVGSSLGVLTALSVLRIEFIA